MKRKTRSAKAGLRFPVARIHNLLKSSTFSMRISAHAPVYLGAVLEYLTAEILETAGVVARQYQHPRITPRHIQIGAKGDEEMGQLLSDVILSEGGVLPEPYRPQLNPQPEKKDTKKKKIDKKKYKDLSRIHIGGPNSLRDNNKAHLKRKRALSCGDDMDRSLFSKRANVRENNFLPHGQEYRGENGQDRHGIGLAFQGRIKVTDKANSADRKSSGPNNNLSFQGYEEIFGKFSCNSYDFPKYDHITETHRDFSKWKVDTSQDGNGSILQTYGDQNYNQSCQSFRESFQSHDQTFQGAHQFFQGSFEKSFSSQHDGMNMWLSDISVSSFNSGSFSPFKSLSHHKLQSETSQNNQRGAFQSGPCLESFSNQKFSESAMSFEDFILERSNIPTNLLKMSVQGASPKNHQLEDVMPMKVDIQNNNLPKDVEISKSNNSTEVPKKKITLKDWKTSKKKNGSSSNMLEKDMKNSVQDSDTQASKSVLDNDTRANNSVVDGDTQAIKSVLDKDTRANNWPSSPEKMEVQTSLSSKSQNIMTQLISDFQIYSESDSSETLHEDESINQDDHISESVVQSTPIKSNNEVNIENYFEWNGTRNDESSLLQNCVVSSSVGLHGSNNSSSNSSSITSPMRRPCPGSKWKHNVGDLVWARLADSSFYPAIVINDPHYKFHTKIVEAIPDSNESGNNRLYHLQFLYKSSRRAWIPSSRIIRYEGITRYEERVKKDVENMSMYRPRNSNLKLQWREAVLTAKRLESLGKLERIGKCEDARLKYLDVSGKEGNRDKRVDAKHLGRKIGGQENHCGDGGNQRKEEMIQKKLMKLKISTPDRQKDLEQKRPRVDKRIKQFSNSADRRNQDKNKLSTREKSIDTSKESMTHNDSQLKMPLNGKHLKLKDVDCLRKMREEFEMVKISSTNNVEETNASHKVKECDKFSSQRKDKVDCSLDEKINDGVEVTSKRMNVVTTVVGEGDMFARPGDLVWARMSGFPHWPGFVTKSPQGIYKKEGKPAGNTNYHVQFFNWNDESGWVNSIVKFYGVDHFKKTKTFRAMKLKSLEKKWYQAACDAEKTIGLSRKERLKEYLVPYDEI